MLRNSLLTIHILSVIVWLGCGLYELFLARELRLARGTPLEVDLARIYLKYSSPVPIATILVVVTGVWMVLALNYGFFQSLWLGSKQGLMLVVLVVFASVLRPFFKLQAEVAGIPIGASCLTRSASNLFDRLEPWLVVMRVSGAVAVVLAVWKPV